MTTSVTWGKERRKERRSVRLRLRGEGEGSVVDDGGGEGKKKEFEAAECAKLRSKSKVTRWQSAYT
jgi:hypothetical protein